MWIQLKSLQRFSKHGTMTTYHPGDWVEVGDHVAKQLIATGQAWVPANRDALLLPANAGIVIRGVGDGGGDYGWLKTYYSTLPIGPDRIGTPYVYTLLWHTRTPLRPELLVIGFHLLARWDMAVPLLDYHQTALDLSTEKDRAETAAVILDLRVPAYNTDLIFVRGTGPGKEVIDLWRDEMTHGDERLAFLRALWTIKPKICALPLSWSQKGPPHES